MKKTRKYSFLVFDPLRRCGGWRLGKESDELGHKPHIADVLISVEELDGFLAPECILDDVAGLDHRIDVVFTPLVPQYPAVLGENSEIP